MRVCTVILARGGSKGILKKNILPIKGKPLIEYTILASANSLSEETFVSTDADDIAAVSRRLGCTIVERPEEYATDEASSEDALLHFASLDEVSKYDTIIFVQPTSPLITSVDIDGGLKMMEHCGYDSVFSVYREHWIPRWSINTGKPILWDMDKRPRRQDASDVFVENGAFYITKRENLLESKLRYSGDIGFYEMPASRSFQIDVDDDVRLMEKLI
tara:strand:+ start:242 stop:892 length:651 start_codon:yes stop_codon:yes gene_type:complete